MKQSDKPKQKRQPGEKKPRQEKAPKPQKEKKAGGSSSSSRLLLVVLLVVVAGAAGAYYFMGLGGTTPAVPTVPAPAQKETKSVAVPPKPASAPAPASVPAPAKPQVATTPAPAKPATAPAPEKPAAAPAQQAKTDDQPQPVAVAVPPPSKPQPAPTPAEPAVAAQPQPAASPADQPPAQAAAPVPEPAPKPQPVAPQPAPAPAAKTTAAVAAPASSPPAAPVPQAAGGGYALDAGSYLYESNRDTLVAKIRKLGYEPLVTPVEARLDMTRLRLGTFSKTEVKEALAFARSIEPGAYSSPAGDNYVIYAGTFLQSDNVEKLKQRFLDEGIKVYAEPVEVVRTLSRIRFGSYATETDASAAAEVAGKSGVKAVVVKSQ